MKEGRKEGIKEGRQEGIKEGMKEGRKELVSDMIKRGKAIDEIVDFCALPVEFVSRVAEEILSERAKS